MIRKLTLAALLSTAVAFPAIAQDKTNKIDPSKAPTGTMTDQVPTMKSETPSTSSSSTVPDKAMGAATPTMKPSDSATATPSVSPMAKTALTETEAKAWIGKPVYSNDQKKIGEVIGFQRDKDNNVSELHAGIGGFLGMGETQVVVTPAQMKLEADRVVVDIPSNQAKDLPKVKLQQ